MAKIMIDEDTCIGCGACVSICPEGFEMVDGKAKVKSQKVKCGKEAVDSCPVQAISIK